MVSAMRASVGLVLFVWACGSKPAPEPVVAKHPPPKPMQANCTDVGVILRGNIEIESDDEKAGPAKEAAITTACETDKWPSSVIDCVASTPRPQECISKLDDKQTASYEARIRAWSEKYGYAGNDTAQTPLRGYDIACDDVLGQVADYS